MGEGSEITAEYLLAGVFLVVLALMAAAYVLRVCSNADDVHEYLADQEALRKQKKKPV